MNITHSQTISAVHSWLQLQTRKVSFPWVNVWIGLVSGGHLGQALAEGPTSWSLKALQCTRQQCPESLNQATHAIAIFSCSPHLWLGFLTGSCWSPSVQTAWRRVDSIWQSSLDIFPLPPPGCRERNTRDGTLSFTYHLDEEKRRELSLNTPFLVSRQLKDEHPKCTGRGTVPVYSFGGQAQGFAWGFLRTWYRHCLDKTWCAPYHRRKHM